MFVTVITVISHIRVYERCVYGLSEYVTQRTPSIQVTQLETKTKSSPLTLSYVCVNHLTVSTVTTSWSLSEVMLKFLTSHHDVPEFLELGRL